MGIWSDRAQAAPVPRVPTGQGLQHERGKGTAVAVPWQGHMPQYCDVTSCGGDTCLI